MLIENPGGGEVGNDGEGMSPHEAASDRKVRAGRYTPHHLPLLNGIKGTMNPRQILLEVGLAAKGGNYNRVYRLMGVDK